MYTGRVGSGRVGSGRVGSGRSGRSGRVGSGWVGSGWVGSGRVGLGRVGSGQVGSVRISGCTRFGRTVQDSHFKLHHKWPVRSALARANPLIEFIKRVRLPGPAHPTHLAIAVSVRCEPHLSSWGTQGKLPGHETKRWQQANLSHLGFAGHETRTRPSAIWTETWLVSKLRTLSA